MRIAICDDQEMFLNSFAELVRLTAKPDDEIFRFNRGTRLLETCTHGYPYDVTFLDIDMPGISGMEAAKEIRLYSKETVIIMVTQYAEYAIDAYIYRPIRYILKPVAPNTLTEVLETARKEALIPKELLIKKKSQSQAVPIRSIYYVDVFGKRLTVHTMMGEITVRGNLSDYNEVLEPHGFFRIHRSIMVNPAHISLINNSTSTVVLRNGDILPVSMYKIAEFTEMFSRHFINESFIGF